MKPHLRLRLRASARHRAVPPWHGRQLADRDDRGLRPEVDAVFRRHRHPVWFTQEYERAHGENWSVVERECALDRTFRAVSQVGRPFSPALVEDLRSVPSVEAVGTMPVATAPITSLSLSSRRSGAWAGELIGLPEAHRTTTGRPDTVVAVLDTGVDARHPELPLAPGRDLVDIIEGAEDFLGDSLSADDVPDDPGVGHGTHVSGVVAARGLAMPVGVYPAAGSCPCACWAPCSGTDG